MVEGGHHICLKYHKALDVWEAEFGSWAMTIWEKVKLNGYYQWRCSSARWTKGEEGRWISISEDNFKLLLGILVWIRFKGLNNRGLLWDDPSRRKVRKIFNDWIRNFSGIINRQSFLVGVSIERSNGYMPLQELGHLLPKAYKSKGNHLRMEKISSALVLSSKCKRSTNVGLCMLQYIELRG